MPLIASTGVSTQPIVDAAQGFLNALGLEPRAHARFPLDTDVWRRWSNIHPYIMRHGVCLDGLTTTQRERALTLVEASLSPAGFKVARDGDVARFRIRNPGELSAEEHPWINEFALGLRRAGVDVRGFSAR